MNLHVHKTRDTTNAPSTSLDTIMVFRNGVSGYNPWGNHMGDLAIYSELDTLDECGGHSAHDGAYHYHSLPMCDKAPLFHGCRQQVSVIFCLLTMLIKLISFTLSITNL